MARFLVLVFSLAVAMAMCCTAMDGSASAAGSTAPGINELAAATAGTWGTAQEVPGSAALNTGGNAEVTSVSCASVGNCAAGKTMICAVTLVRGSGRCTLSSRKLAAGSYKLLATYAATSNFNASVSARKVLTVRR